MIVPAAVPSTPSAVPVAAFLGAILVVLHLGQVAVVGRMLTGQGCLLSEWTVVWCLKLVADDTIESTGSKDGRKAEGGWRPV